MIDLKEIECFLLDMDGTFYLGDELIEGALKFIDILEKQGKEYIFLTNNSSKNSRNYQKKLDKLGLSVPLERIVNSGEVTANYIKKRCSKARVYVVGTPNLKEEFRQFGLEVVEEKEFNIDYVVLGFDTTLTYKKLWAAHDLILDGVEYIATNPDYVCPLEEGNTMPDCGAMINLLKTSTGEEPLVVGKPNTVMIEYISSLVGADKEKMAMIGDRLYTDIKTANRAGITSVLVLSGDTDREELKESSEQPDYVLESIRELGTKLNKE